MLGGFSAKARQNQVQRLVIDRAANLSAWSAWINSSLVAFAAQGFDDMLDIALNRIRDEQVDDGRLRHAFQPLLVARMHWKQEGTSARHRRGLAGCPGSSRTNQGAR